MSCCENNYPIFLFLVLQIHNIFPLLSELPALQRLTRVVPLHVIGWAKLHIKVPLFDAVSNKEVSNIQVPGALAGTLLSILLQ